MKRTRLYNYPIKMIAMLIGIVMMTIAFLNILYHYDNKYTSKAAFSQDGVCLAPGQQHLKKRRKKVE